MEGGLSNVKQISCLDSRLHPKYGLLRNRLESVSGYLESPSLKGIFASQTEIKYYFEFINTYFYVNLFLSKLRIIPSIRIVSHIITSLFRKPIFLILNPSSNNKGIKVIRNILRKIAKKYFK